MKFEQLFSGSKANAYILTADSGERLLIECGVAWKKLMNTLNYDLKGIVGCILTHEHGDHSRAVKDVLKAGIDVYSSLRTLDTLHILGNRRAFVIGDNFAKLKPFGIRTFDVNHDAVEPIGFHIECDGKDMLFVTDTSHINYQFTRNQKRIKFETIAIECSYDEDVLQYKVDSGEIHEELAKRLLTSHMETKEAIRYLHEDCDLSQCTELHLLHLSGDNIDKKRVANQFFNRFFIETIVVEG